MNQARGHVLSRLAALREPAVERPSSPYADCTAAIDAFGESKLADELFVIPHNVQIFYIDGDDATIPSYPTALKIFKFRLVGETGKRFWFGEFYLLAVNLSWIRKNLVLQCYSYYNPEIILFWIPILYNVSAEETKLKQAKSTFCAVFPIPLLINKMTYALANICREKSTNS